MDHLVFRKKLGELLSGNLDKREASLLQEHIDNCSACSMILEEVKASFVPQRAEAPKTSAEVGEVSVPGYEIIERLGKGGMGAVYKAEQTSLGRIVAIKVLFEELSKNDTLIQRFEREARAAAKLTHPNLIHVYDFGKSDKVHFITMEFVDGKTVYQLIRDMGKINPKKTLEIALKVAEALDYAFQNGIIHRDIKPENIMIDSIGEVKIADMGLAKEIGGDKDEHGNITMMGERLGTPYYMSPEQIKETRSVDHRADIYSLGTTMFHMITGRRPFAGATSVETMELVLNSEAGFTDKEKEFAPSAVRKLIINMMEKLPNKRPEKWKHVIKSISGLIQSGMRGIVRPHKSKKH